MNKILTLLFLVISIISQGQNLETTKVKVKSQIDGITIKETYYVLKSDNSMKHGEYKRYNVLNDIVESGFFNLGKKDSIWKTYIAGKLVESQGKYCQGKRSGLWNYYTNIPGSWKPSLKKSGYYSNESLVGVWSYYKDGALEQQFDYTNDSLVFTLEVSDNNLYLVKTESGIIQTKLDKAPMLIGGNVVRLENWKNMNHRILDSISNGKSDIAYIVSFWIKPNGDTYGYEMSKSVNKIFDSYIIEYYKKNYKWLPGQLDGMNVECKVEVSDGYLVRM